MKSHSSFDLGTPERGNHHEIKLEYADEKGLVVRARNLTPHAIDKLARNGTITADQHNAGLSFMRAVEKTGALISSPDLQRAGSTAAPDPSGRMAVRIMAAASAIKYMRETAGDHPTRRVVSLIVREDIPQNPQGIEALKAGLSALVMYYQQP